MRPRGLETSVTRASSPSVSGRLRVSEPPALNVLDLDLSTLPGNMTSSNPDQRLEHLLSAVESEFQKGSEKGDASERDIKLTLDDADLWNKFKELTNEMIVTKTGR